MEKFQNSNAESGEYPYYQGLSTKKPHSDRNYFHPDQENDKSKDNQSYHDYLPLNSDVILNVFAQHLHLHVEQLHGHIQHDARIILLLDI